MLAELDPSFTISIAIEPGVSVTAGMAGATCACSVGMLVGITGTAVSVGLGISANAHKFSCVGAGLGSRILRIDALAGEVAKKKMVKPALRNNRIPHRMTNKRVRLFEKSAFMGLHSKRVLAQCFRCWQSTVYLPRLPLQCGRYVW